MPKWRATTILAVRHQGTVAIGGDGQVTLGNVVMKSDAHKIRRLHGGKVLTGSNIGGIKETQEMLDFCASKGIGAVIEKIGVHDVDAAYDRVVAGDVKFRFVIDTSTFEE